jgi:hypothetical protein
MSNILAVITLELTGHPPEIRRPLRTDRRMRMTPGSPQEDTRGGELAAAP